MKIFSTLTAGLLMPVALFAADLNISPAVGTVSNIQNFTLSAAPGTTVVMNPDVAAVDLTVKLIKDGNTDPYATFVTTADNDGITLSLVAPITYAGNYTISVPAGLFLINDAPNTDMEFGPYVIEQRQAPKELFVTPGAGTTVPEIAGVAICWQGYGEVFLSYDDLDYSTTKIFFEFNGEKIPAVGLIDADEISTTYTFTPQESITGEGRVRLTIPKEEITIAGAHPDRDITYYWDLKRAEGSSLIVTPGAGELSEINTFKIAAPDGSPEMVLGNSGYDINLYMREGSDWAILANYTCVANGDGTYTASCGQTYTTPGSYRLFIPSGYFRIANKITPAMNVYYTVTTSGSVNEILDGAANVTVVSLDGTVLLNNAPADALNSLENGLYIINGKAVLLRK